MGQAMVAISEPACTGCDLCIHHCPFEALLPRFETLPGRKKRDVIVMADRCVGCLSCIGSCPTSALFEINIPVNAKSSELLDAQWVAPKTESINRWGRGGKPNA